MDIIDGIWYRFTVLDWGTQLSKFKRLEEKYISIVGDLTREIVTAVGDQIVSAIALRIGVATKIDAGTLPAAGLLFRVGCVGRRDRRVVFERAARSIQ